jgi:hypothetical protein
MTRLLTLACIAAAGLSIAGAAAALNPQPLPPRCVAGAHCDPIGRAHVRAVELSRHCRITRHHRHCWR